MFYHGNSTILTCTGEGGPGNIFQWTFNETILENETSNHLVLPFITAISNGGVYSCTVSNAAGNSSNSSSVFVYPVITVNPSDNFTVYHEEVTFSCEATAFPYPEYQWFRDDGLSPYYYAYYAYGVYTSVLTILPYYDSEGDYYCQASSNGMSVESERATLYGMYYDM